MQLGASPYEIALVVYLMVLIGIAPKVGKIGEFIGGLFERSGAGSGENSQGGAEDGERRE